jgi:predicted DNA-binding transcriptional regulator YafY
MPTDHLDTVRLALELLRRIPRGRKVTAPQLRAQLADAGIVREPKTIRRQLAFLCEHFDVERDDARPAGYCRIGGAKAFTLAAMSEHEALLLRLAQQQLAAFLPPSVTRSLDGFFAEAHRSLDPLGDARLARQWLGKVRVINPTLKMLPAKIRPGVFENVSQALYANRWLRVRYRDGKGNASDKKVMPLGLAQQGPRLYLVFRYAADARDQSLVLHRMLSAEQEVHTFERPDFDFDRFDDDGAIAFGTGKRVRLRVRITREAGNLLRETPLSKDQDIREDGDHLIVTATVADSLLLKRWLFGFSEEISEWAKEEVQGGVENEKA